MESSSDEDEVVSDGEWLNLMMETVHSVGDKEGIFVTEFGVSFGLSQAAEVDEDGDLVVVRRSVAPRGPTECH